MIGEGERNWIERKKLDRKSLRLWCASQKIFAKLKGALVHLPREESAMGRNCQAIVSPLRAVLSNWQGLPGEEHSLDSNAAADPNGLVAGSLLKFHGYCTSGGNFINWPSGL